jgi:hypothetical protein
MAELTNLESKLGEVLGLAMAAQVATRKVIGLLDDDSHGLGRELERMREEAAETEHRCTEVAGSFNGKKTAILEQARETKSEAAGMMDIYLGEDSDALDGFEFLTMAEAGEVGHWSIVKTFSEGAESSDLKDLVEWALPIQQRHYETTLAGSLQLAADEDPNDTA